VEAERFLVEYLKRLLEQVAERKKLLSEKAARGEISPDDLAQELLKLKALEEAIREELSRLGAGVEA